MAWSNPRNQSGGARLLRAGVKLDSTNAEAYSGIAYSRTRDFANGWAEPGTDQAALVTGPADRALAINPRNGMAAYAKGIS